MKNQTILKINAKTRQVITFHDATQAAAHIAGLKRCKLNTARCALSAYLNGHAFDPDFAWARVSPELATCIPRVAEVATLTHFFQTFEWGSLQIDFLKGLRTQLSKGAKC